MAPRIVANASWVFAEMPERHRFKSVRLGAQRVRGGRFSLSRLEPDPQINHTPRGRLSAVTQDCASRKHYRRHCSLPSGGQHKLALRRYEVCTLQSVAQSRHRGRYRLIGRRPLWRLARRREVDAPTIAGGSTSTWLPLHGAADGVRPDVVRVSRRVGARYRERQRCDPAHTFRRGCRRREAGERMEEVPAARRDAPVRFMSG